MKSPAFPSEATVELFRSALRVLPLEAAAGDRAISPETPAGAELRAALRALCDDAREHALRAEQLLVIFKEIWRALPEVRAMPDPATRDALLSRAIGLCLDEYYRET